jgi:undecaprenyl diphosphate synthase
MDGNGRWAEDLGFPRAEGHRVGSEVVNQIVRCCRRWGLKYLTLYAFSEQNWGRPQDEVGVLMGLLSQYLAEQRAEILERRIRLRAIGALQKLPALVRAPLLALIEETREAQGMTLTLALSYGGREEIVSAARSIAQKIIVGEMSPDEITEETIQEHLYTPDIPEPDLIIRTSGEQRLSNFLLWQSAYTEFDFIPVPWPQFHEGILRESLSRFKKRERRFGLTSAQLDVSTTSADSSKIHDQLHDQAEMPNHDTADSSISPALDTQYTDGGTYSESGYSSIKSVESLSSQSTSPSLLKV